MKNDQEGQGMICTALVPACVLKSEIEQSTAPLGQCLTVQEQIQVHLKDVGSTIHREG